MRNNSLAQLSDPELIDATRAAIARERGTTVELIPLLAEVDARRLYLGLGYSSMFMYCTQALHLSESSAYSRIAAARAARRFPSILPLLTEGWITLTTVCLLAPELTDENHETLLDAARHKSKDAVRQLVASLHPQPDIRSSVRQLPAPALLKAEVPEPPAAAEPPASVQTAEPRPAIATSPIRRPLVAPLSSDRYLMRITIGDETHTKLSRARDLLRHAIPNGDPAAIIDRALTALLEQLEKTKVAATTRPRSAATDASSRSRHVPAPVKRAVWARDGGRCAFIGANGRCAETGFLEFHHVVPFSAGGATDVENLQLRCRAHNAHEATLYFNSVQTELMRAKRGIEC